MKRKIYNLSERGDVIIKKGFKLLFFGSIFSLMLVGCGTKNSSDIISKLDNKLKNADSYYVTGVMDIINNEDTYTYDVNISYKKDNYYKIGLINKLNNHEQVILRNDDGVYVVTPSLNKSFKFQSDWPYNNSQVYLFGSIINDLKDDNNRTFKTKDNGYILKSLVNYPNNKSLAKQNVYVDSKMNITKVEVTDKNNKVQISMKFDKVKFNKKFDKDYFELSNLINISNNKSNVKNNNNDTANNKNITDNKNNSVTNEEESNNSNVQNNENNTTDSSDNKNNSENKTTKQTATIDDVIYPMYLPDNTTLANKEVVNTDAGQRLILTFDGDKPFILVEETTKYHDNGLVVPVSGELDFLTDVIGVVGDNSLTWESNGIEYYLVSNTVKTSELIEIARSINVLPVSK